MFNARPPLISFDDIMNEEVSSATPGFNPAAHIATDNYAQVTQFQNLLTYSTTETLHSCPRKFALNKLATAAGAASREGTVTFAFGHAVGAGVAEYDVAQDINAAIWAAFLAWDVDLLAEERRSATGNGKSFHEAIWALMLYRTFYAEETDLAEYASIQTEATTAIDFENGYFHVGHIDEVLQHRETGRLRVKENKTTGLTNVDESMYANSDQASGYSVAVDMLGAADYEVLYTVYSSGAREWKQFNFVKSTLIKAEWIQDQYLIQEQLRVYTKLNFFPKRGASCFSFMRRCPHFGTCDRETKMVYQKNYADLPQLADLTEFEQIEAIDYRTTINAVIQRQRNALTGE